MTVPDPARIPVLRQDGDHETLPWLGGARVRIVADSTVNAGAICVLTIEAGQGYAAARHTHQREDELFVVLAGSMSVYAGAGWSELSEGGMVMLPRAVPHAYRITSPRARLLNICTPGGLDQFFRDASELLRSAPPDPSRAITALARGYGVSYD